MRCLVINSEELEVQLNPLLIAVSKDLVSWPFQILYICFTDVISHDINYHKTLSCSSIWSYPTITVNTNSQVINKMYYIFIKVQFISITLLQGIHHYKILFSYSVTEILLMQNKIFLYDIRLKSTHDHNINRVSSSFFIINIKKSFCFLIPWIIYTLCKFC